MKWKKTEWHKFFELDDEGNPTGNQVAWKVTDKNGVVFKSQNWRSSYDDRVNNQNVVEQSKSK